MKTQFNEEYTAQFKTDGDLAVDVNDFSATETLESDRDPGEAEEREIEQETAIAAARSNRNISKSQAHLAWNFSMSTMRIQCARASQKEVPCTAIRQLGQSPGQFRKLCQKRSM